MLEFTLTLLPLLGFVFVTIDIGWAVFARSSLQSAVREGCRFAITSRTLSSVTDGSGNTFGHIDSIKYRVQHSAMGFLGSKTSDAGWSLIKVRFYSPTNLTTALTAPSSSSSTKIHVGGNIVEVSVEGFQLAGLLPLLRNTEALKFTARSADRMEASPSTGAPNYYTGLGY